MTKELKKYFNVYVGLSIVCWVFLLGIDLYTIYAAISQIDIFVNDFFIYLLLSLCFLFIFLSFKLHSSKSKSRNFLEQFWQVFIIGAFTIFFSLFIKFFLFLINDTALSNNIYLVNVLYHVNIGLIAVFIANAFYVWRRMNLYQKSEITHQAWYIFEILVLLTILTNFFQLEFQSVPFIIISFPLVIYALILSFNLKWVAFLNYNQKWQSILLITLIILISITFVQQIYEHNQTQILVVDLINNTFVMAMFGFICLNSFISLLVLFFNLPTSSVFEQKFGEVMIFQRLSQSIQMGNKEEEVYQTLFDSSMDIVMADAAWLEIMDEHGNYTAFLNRDISEIDVFEIKKLLRKNKIRIDNEPLYIKDLRSYPESERVKSLDVQSMLMIPLSSHNYKMGNLVLLKNLADGFDKEMVDIIFTFATQASIALKNFRLISDAIENERYKEELAIAKKVQQSLLPPSSLVNVHLEISSFSRSSDQIGGDYFDFYEQSKEKLAIVIGDVSGSGTSAAFNMALLKGVFHGLVQLETQSDQFMELANNALGKCLEKTSFITLALFYIDVERKQINYARAGHCPPLFIDASAGTCEYLESKGLGLALLRNKDYSKHIQESQISYGKDDVLVIYTDGITEAKNNLGEEYGQEKLKSVISVNYHLTSKQISEKLVEDLYAFTGQTDLNDDYTFLVIKLS
jgi:sigma-B regulation protein RsbU (phosphoserine phosphatase)